MQAQIESFYDAITGTISYVVYDRVGGSAAIIDPVLDFDPKAGRTSTESLDKIAQVLNDKQLQVQWILETHAHADHLSAAQTIKQKWGGKVAIGKNIQQVQQVFRDFFNLETGFATDGSQFDHLFEDNETFAIGDLQASAMWVPGHTLADMAYRIGDVVFVGDNLFMPDVGTARCDFPGGDAKRLYQSIQRILSLPANTQLYMCHDYPLNGRAPAWISTVQAQRQHNIHVHDGVSEEAYVRMRQERDATLEMPVLILPSVQVNIRAGHMPPAEDNGQVYLKVPVNRL